MNDNDRPRPVSPGRLRPSAIVLRTKPTPKTLKIDVGGATQRRELWVDYYSEMQPSGAVHVGDSGKMEQSRKFFAMPRSRIDPTDKHVGNRVRMCRVMKNMTQQRVAELVGLTFQQVQKYEKGINRISAGRLQHLSQIFQVPVPFFFADGLDITIKKPEPISDYVHDFLATRDGIELAKEFSRIQDRNVRRAIVGLVEQIVPE
jgi:transcriptional regulator with XRE-family HTH domain